MTVAVTIKGRGVDVGPRLEDHIEKKVGKLDRYLSTIREVRVDVSEAESVRASSDRYVAQLTIPMRGTTLRAEVRDSDLFSAIDQVLSKIYKQIERYKGKRRRVRDGASAADVAPDIDEVAPGAAEDEEQAGTVVRRKQFSVQPMSEAEALEQMILLGHEQFFVYFSAESNRINVLYKRRDGNYGLIDPVMD
jgi:putative sigma-54 modulation protein